jgi:hypothetical protein
MFPFYVTSKYASCIVINLSATTVYYLFLIISYGNETIQLNTPAIPPAFNVHNK